MTDFTIIVTDAGRAALVNAANTGTAPVTIAQAGISATAIVPSPSITAIPGEIKRIATLSGDVVADDTIHLIVRDESADSYTLRTIGLYLADGTLFAVYGQAAAIMEKSSMSMLLLAMDIKFADVAAADLTFGDANFLNPPATTEALGVVELATNAEAITGTDPARVVTAKALLAALNARLGNAAPTDFVKTLLALADVAAFRNALAIKSAALKDEGAGGGLDADKLDGQHAAYFLPAASYTAADVLAKLLTVDGAGSGVDADTLDGAHAAHFLAAAAYTAADVLAKLLTVDGAGSGLDADLLDGRQGIAYLGPNTAGSYAAYGASTLRGGYYGILLGSTINHMAVMFDPLGRGGFYREAVGFSLYFNGTDWFVGNTGGTKVWHAGNDGAGSGLDADTLDGAHAAYFLPAAAYTAADVMDKVIEAESLGVNGYIRLNNGLMLQWGQYAVSADYFGPMTFPISFPTACFTCVGSHTDEPGNNNAAQNGCTVTSVSTTGATLNNPGTAGTFFWFAVGK